MIRVTIKNYGTFRINEGTSLISLLVRKQIPIPAACNGQGRCGLCRVRIKTNTQPCDPVEKIFLPKELEKQGYHLACRFRPHIDTTVIIPSKKIMPSPVRSKGLFALDLGTTVIKGALVNIQTGKTIRSARTLNIQNTMGADVITRIGKAIAGEYNMLYKMLMKSVDECKHQLGLKLPLFTTVTGNCVMLSFYLKRPVDGLAKYPFHGLLNNSILRPKPPSYIFPVIGGFVGGDIISGLLACGIYKTNKIVLYTDLGTNGEVVLATPEKIYAASTAAGPAFEGVGIRSGCLAIPGAIKSVGFSRGKFTYSVIDNMNPIGLCASGLINALYHALQRGYISDSGKLNKSISIGEFPIDQNDIRKLQLAVGAIRAGMTILMKQIKLSLSSIDQIIITGEFGGRLDPIALKRIGLIPSGKMKVTSRKDLALKGAIMAGIDDRMRAKIDDIKQKSVHVALATHSDFQREFIHAMRFSPWK